jgi:trimethylamine--corrinoid protein Co-methyltransferase
MTFPKAQPREREHVCFLTNAELQGIHEASLSILRDTGIRVEDPETLQALASAGARIESAHPIAHLPESAVSAAITSASKTYVLHGRDGGCPAQFGKGAALLMSSPGQHAWIDLETDRTRPAALEDAHAAIRVADALPHIDIVGAMAQPAELNACYREVLLAAELIKGTTKPTRSWVTSVETARRVLELHRVAAGGDAPLRAQPRTEGFLTPISPLHYPAEGLGVAREFIRAGQPVCLASMPTASGTAPVTLGGAIALAHAELLAGNVIVQQLGPGTPILYGGIPHILDPRTSQCSFGAPEQGLMAVAMTQLGHHCGFPVYVNVGLSDAKLPDLQAGIEKGATLTLGMLAGANLFGHAGICGADHGASLLWLCADNELMAYVKRLARGIELNPETLATDVVRAVGPRGNFLTEPHTARHLRRELWSPGGAWTRQSFSAWETAGRLSMADRLRSEVRRCLQSPPPAPVAPDLAQALDDIVRHAETDPYH